VSTVSDSLCVSAVSSESVSRPGKRGAAAVLVRVSNVLESERAPGPNTK
jgi:hypothetical protein